MNPTSSVDLAVSVSRLSGVHLPRMAQILHPQTRQRLNSPRLISEPMRSRPRKCQRGNHPCLMNEPRHSCRSRSGPLNGWRIQRIEHAAPEKHPARRTRSFPDAPLRRFCPPRLEGISRHKFSSFADIELARTPTQYPQCTQSGEHSPPKTR